MMMIVIVIVIVMTMIMIMTISDEGDDDGDDGDEDDEDEDYDNVYMLIGGYSAVWTVRSMLAASTKVLGQAGASCPMRMETNTLVRRE